MQIAHRPEERDDVEVERESLTRCSERMGLAEVAAEAVDEGNSGFVSRCCWRGEVGEGEERDVQGFV